MLFPRAAARSRRSVQFLSVWYLYVCMCVCAMWFWPGEGSQNHISSNMVSDHHWSFWNEEKFFKNFGEPYGLKILFVCFKMISDDHWSFWASVVLTPPPHHDSPKFSNFFFIYELRTFVWTTRSLCVAFLLSNGDVSKNISPWTSFEDQILKKWVNKEMWIAETEEVQLFPKLALQLGVASWRWLVIPHWILENCLPRIESSVARLQDGVATTFHPQPHLRNIPK